VLALLQGGENDGEDIHEESESDYTEDGDFFENVSHTSLDNYGFGAWLPEGSYNMEVEGPQHDLRDARSFLKISIIGSKTFQKVQ
jgi:hypothetical protein